MTVTLCPPSALFPEDENYFALLNGLKQRIWSAQIKVALAVNRELILYQQIESEILERQQVEGWGSRVIERLAKDLKREFPDTKGFSRTDLIYMRAFAEAYPNEQFVLRHVGQIAQGHNQTLLNKLESLEQHLW